MHAFVKRSDDRDDVDLAWHPVPRIDDDELLVRVRAIGVGVHDGYFLPPGVSYPFPIGIEAAGVVEQTGSGVTGYHRGERVVFISAMQPKGGTWAEYAAVQQDSLIVRIPESMDFTEAAAVPVAANTALRALHALPMRFGDSLFVAGASGAIGTFAVQLAKSRGYLVAGSASAASHAYLSSLGADLAVDYNDVGWPDQITRWAPGGVAAAIAVQPGTGADSLRVVQDEGGLVLVSGDRVAPQRGVRVEQVSHQVDTRGELDQLMTDIAEGRIRAVIERVYSFEDALQALRKTQTRHARGKQVVSMDSGNGS